MNNIAEGFFRRSDSEFRQFLNVSKGSTGELKSMYYFAEDQSYVTADVAIDRRNRCQRIMAGNSSLMNYLKVQKQKKT